MNLKHNRLFIIFLLVSVSLCSQSAQKKIDSLMQVAEVSNDSVRLRIYNKVSFYYIFNNPEKARDLLLKGIEQAKTKKVSFSEAELVNTYGIYNDVSGKSDSAKYYFEKALALSEAHNYRIITVMIINNLGMFHWNKGNYQVALDYFFQALEINKENSVDSGDGTYFNNIGLIYQEMGQSDKALEYHKKALEVRERYNNKSEIATSLSNIAIVLKAQGNYVESEQNFKRAIEMAKAENELGKYYDALDGLGDTYLEQNQPQLAIPLLKELLEGRNENNIDRRSNLNTISNLIRAFNATGNLTTALKYVEKGNAFLNEFPDKKTATIEFYQHASETYFRLNNPENGAAYLQQALLMKEDIFSNENADAIANLETKFKVAEKERDLAETRANLAESELENEQKNIFIFGMIALAIVLTLLGYLFYNQQKLKNSQLRKESELRSALAKIETQNQLQEQRLRISRDLHDNIGSQLTFIISSIDNLKFGFKDADASIKGKLKYISNFTSQTIYELRDTIWAMNKTDISVEDLQTRIANFIEKAKSASDVEFTFNVDKNISKETHFNSVQGMNIYRIIQESINNALKYANATTIEVLLSRISSDKLNDNGTETFKLEIIDDGKGFDSEAEITGHGISNIQKRAKDLNGKTQIISEIGKGTHIKVIF